MLRATRRGGDVAKRGAFERGALVLRAVRRKSREVGHRYSAGDTGELIV